MELHWILQVFCVRQEDGGGVNRGSYRYSKSGESGEDPGQLEAPFLIFLTPGLIKQSNTRSKLNVSVRVRSSSPEGMRKQDRRIPILVY